MTEIEERLAVCAASGMTAANAAFVCVVEPHVAYDFARRTGVLFAAASVAGKGYTTIVPEPPRVKFPTYVTREQAKKIAAAGTLDAIKGAR